MVVSPMASSMYEERQGFHSNPHSNLPLSPVFNKQRGPAGPRGYPASHVGHAGGTPKGQSPAGLGYSGGRLTPGSAHSTPSTLARHLDGSSPYSARNVGHPPSSVRAAPTPPSAMQAPPSTPPRYAGGVQALSPLSPFSPDEQRPGLRKERYAEKKTAFDRFNEKFEEIAGSPATRGYRQIRPPSLGAFTSELLAAKLGGATAKKPSASSHTSYQSNSSACASASSLDLSRGGSDDVLLSPTNHTPTRFKDHMQMNTTQVGVRQARKEMTTHEIMGAFSFGDPPSPTSSQAIRSFGPPLGKQVKPTTQDREEAPESIMKRFTTLVNELAVVTEKKQPGSDLLPHLSASEIVKQLVRRINGFTDSGGAKQVEDYRPVFASFMRLLEVLFTRMGKTVRSSALVDLLGCLFDMLLAFDYCRSWVSRCEIRTLMESIKEKADVNNVFSSLLLMVRQQCSQISPSTGEGLDKDALGLCIAEMLPVAKTAAKRGSKDIAALLKEVYRFTDSHDSHWSAMKLKYSLSDPPHNPSPLGMVYYVVVHIVAYAGMTEVKRSLVSLDVPANSRLHSVIEQAYRSLLKERQRKSDERVPDRERDLPQRTPLSPSASRGGGGGAGR